MKNRKTEKNKEELRKITLLDDNKVCMDCGMRGPLYVVTDFSIFVCSTCSACHRSMQHKVKGISMSEFTDDEIAAARVGGNGRASRIWKGSYRGMAVEGDERSIKEYIRQLFVEKRYYNVQEYTRFLEDCAQASLPPVKVLSSLPEIHAPSHTTSSAAHNPQQHAPQPQQQQPAAPVVVQAQVVQAIPVQQAPAKPAVVAQSTPSTTKQPQNTFEAAFFFDQPQQQQQTVHQPTPQPTAASAPQHADAFDSFFSAPQPTASASAPQQQAAAAPNRPLDVHDLFGNFSGAPQAQPQSQQQQQAQYYQQQQPQQQQQQQVQYYQPQPQPQQYQTQAQQFQQPQQAPLYAAQQQINNAQYYQSPPGIQQPLQASYASQHQVSTHSYAAPQQPSTNSGPVNFFDPPPSAGGGGGGSVWQPAPTMAPTYSHQSSPSQGNGSSQQQQSQSKPDVFAALDPFGGNRR